MKTVLVTGSSIGIGASTIKQFAKNGYNVIINYVKHESDALKLKEFVEKEYGISALAIKCDISNEAEVISMVREAIKEYGNIDVLVNNAGIALDNEIMDKSKEEFMKVLETNVVGTFLVTREVIKTNEVSAIVNVSSSDSIDTYNTLNIDYSTSKAGVNMLTKVFSMKYPKIKVCAVMPNFVDTPSIREMDSMYLEEELRRVNQKKLISSEYISKMIYKIVEDEKIKTANLIRIDGEE